MLPDIRYDRFSYMETFHIRLHYSGRNQLINILASTPSICRKETIRPAHMHSTLPETNIFAPENGWLEY